MWCRRKMLRYRPLNLFLILRHHHNLEAIGNRNFAGPNQPLSAVATDAPSFPLAASLVTVGYSMRSAASTTRAGPRIISRCLRCELLSGRSVFWRGTGHCFLTCTSAMLPCPSRSIGCRNIPALAHETAHRLPCALRRREWRSVARCQPSGGSALATRRAGWCGC